jgi:hypothetical protein
MIAIRGLTKRCGQVAAVEDLSFKVHAGTVVGFLGVPSRDPGLRAELLARCLLAWWLTRVVVLLLTAAHLRMCAGSTGSV